MILVLIYIYYIISSFTTTEYTNVIVWVTYIKAHHIHQDIGYNSYFPHQNVQAERYGNHIVCVCLSVNKISGKLKQLGAHNYMLKITDQFSVQDCMSIQYILLSSYGKCSVGNSNSKKYVCTTGNNWTYTY